MAIEHKYRSAKQLTASFLKSLMWFSVVLLGTVIPTPNVWAQG
jgi:hypothetical protein